MLTNAKIIGKIKLKFCFTTAYSELHFSFGLFRSTNNSKKLWNTAIIVETTNVITKSNTDISTAYLANASTISIEII